MEKISPSIVGKDFDSNPVVQYPTHIEYLLAFALKGCKWAEDALPEAIERENLRFWPFNNGGGI